MTENNEYKPVPFTEEEYADSLKMAQQVTHLFLTSQNGKTLGRAMQVLGATLTYVSVESLLFFGVDKEECLHFLAEVHGTSIKALEVYDQAKNINKSNDKSH